MRKKFSKMKNYAKKEEKKRRGKAPPSLPTLSHPVDLKIIENSEKKQRKLPQN